MIQGIVSSGSIFHSNYLVEGLEKHNMLCKYIVGNHKNKELNIKKEKIKNIKFQNYIGYILRKVSVGKNRIPYNYISDNLFDIVAAYNYKRCDFFIGFNNYSLYQMKKYKKAGIPIFLEQRTAHVNTEIKISKESLGYIPINLRKKIVDKKIKEYALADYILVGSEYVKKTFIENGVSDEKILVIPYGYNEKDYYLMKNEKRFFEKYLNIIFVGQIGLRKGVNFLLEAIKNLKKKGIKINLKLVGNIDKEFLNTFNDYKDYFSYEGFKNIVELRYLYNEADLMVFPSLCEGSARVLYEASACGLPIITTYSSGSIIKNNVDGFLINSMSSKEIETKVEELYNDRNILKKISIDSNEKIKEYTWSNYSKNIAITINNVMNLSKEKNE